MKGEINLANILGISRNFVMIASAFFIAALISAFRGSIFLWFIAISGAVLFLLGVALMVLTMKEKVRGMLKKFLILTGASSAGVPVFAFLHNAIYGLFIYWFGADFWDRLGLGDEPLFFVLATLVCPIAFLVGAVGSIVFRHQEVQESKLVL